jgi:hypothetical protein
MENELCLVQFIHPGGEHRPDDGLFKRWNRAAHKRKFLKQGGMYLSAGKLNDGTIPIPSTRVGHSVRLVRTQE